MSNPGWDAFELHVHTREGSPCASVPAKQQAQIYQEAGYRGIVVTDHCLRWVLDQYGGSWKNKVDGFLRGYRNAREEGEKLGLHVFLGAEMRLDSLEEDFLLYGADEDFFYAQPELYRLPLPQFSALCREHGYFLAQAHPFRPGNLPRDGQYLEGAELYNGHPGHFNDVPAAAAWLWENGLLPLSGSDSHDPRTQARGGVCVPGGVETIQELIGALRQNRYALIVPPGERGHNAPSGKPWG